jgi:hypothetical protein
LCVLVLFIVDPKVSPQGRYNIRFVTLSDTALNQSTMESRFPGAQMLDSMLDVFQPQTRQVESQVFPGPILLTPALADDGSPAQIRQPRSQDLSGPICLTPGLTGSRPKSVKPGVKVNRGPKCMTSSLTDWRVGGVTHFEVLYVSLFVSSMLCISCVYTTLLAFCVDT